MPKAHRNLVPNLKKKFRVGTSNSLSARALRETDRHTDRHTQMGLILYPQPLMLEGIKGNFDKYSLQCCWTGIKAWAFSLRPSFIAKEIFNAFNMTLKIHVI